MIKLGVNNKTLSIYAELSYEVVSSFSDIPKEFSLKASGHLESWQKSGKIEDHEFFNNRLRYVWEFIEKSKYEGAILAYIAQGYPKISGISIDVEPDSDSEVVWLNIRDQNRFMNYHPIWLARYINQQLSSRKVERKVSESQLMSLVLRLKMGFDIKKTKLNFESSYNPRHDNRAYYFRTKEESGYVDVQIGMGSHFKNSDNFKKFLLELRSFCEKHIEQKGSGCLLLNSKQIQNSIRRFRNGPEVLDLGLPKSFLIATDLGGAFEKIGVSFFQVLLWHLTRLGDFECSEEWFSRNLNFDISKTLLTELKPLLQSRILKQRENSPALVRNEQIVFRKNWSSNGRNYKKMFEPALNLGAASLENVKANNRSIQGYTIALNREKAEKIKVKISELRAQIVGLEPTSFEQCYVFSTQFVSLTRHIDIQKEEMENTMDPRWLGAVVREMIGLSDFKPDPVWVKKRLATPASITEIAKFLEALKKANLIQLNRETGRYECPDSTVQTEFETKSKTVIDFHKAMINNVMYILGKNNDGSGNGANLCFVECGVNQIKQLKEMINTFFQDIMTLDQQFGSCENVYQVNVQLFPVILK